MRVLVTGAYGLIGSACLARLFIEDHEIVATGRNITWARRRTPFVGWRQADFRNLTGIEAWRPLLAGIDAVVNCVGVLQDGAGDDTHRVHVIATCALFDACQRIGIRRVVHVSAVGVDVAGPTDFSRTKAEADRHLQSLDLDWVILRPGLVVAPAVYGGTALLRGIAGFPFVTPLVGAAARIQIISIDDLAETVAMCVRPGAPSKVTWDVAHPKIYSLVGIVVAMRAWLGFPTARWISLPRPMAAAIVVLADLLGRLGWRSPARSTSLAQLEAGAVGDPGAWMAATGIAPKSLEAFFASRPATVQDRWFSRLYFLKPLAIAGLAAFLIFSGIATARMVSGSVQWFRAMIAETSFATVITSVLVAIGAIIDVVLGVAVLVRATARMALIATVLVTVGAAMFNAVMLLRYAPQPWFELFGIVSGAIPVLLVALFSLATLDDR